MTNEWIFDIESHKWVMSIYQLGTETKQLNRFSAHLIASIVFFFRLNPCFNQLCCFHFSPSQMSEWKLQITSLDILSLRPHIILRVVEMMMKNHLQLLVITWRRFTSNHTHVRRGACFGWCQLLFDCNQTGELPLKWFSSNK